jgi:replicative DNA helicase
MDYLETSTFLANIEAEQTVLGQILLEPEVIKDCVLKMEHFYDPRHQNLFYVMRELDEKGIPLDLVAIVERVGNAKVEKIGGISYLSEMAGSMPTAANFGYYQGLVIEYFEKRQTYEIARQMMQNTMEQEPGEVRTAAIEALSALDDNNMDNDDGNIKQSLIDLYDWMEKDHGDITGAPTGFAELDRMLSGLQRQDLVIIGARPSMGKTAFVLNVGLNTMEHHGNPVGIFSLEMPEQGLLKRMMSNLGNINAEKMRNPMAAFNDGDWGKSTMALGQLHNMPLHIFDKPAQDVGYIRKKCRALKRKYPDDHIVIMIDYLQLIIGNPKHGGNRTAEISEISRQLKQIARELDLTLIALSQLSRGVEQRQDKRPMMSDIRESGQIEQDADVIGFLYRDDYYDKESENKNIIEIIIAKQRNGPIGTVQLAFVKEYNKFVNLERRFDGGN